MILPYVYKITHRETGEFYIGFRSINKVRPEFDLGFKYFTSSKTVKQLGFENFNIEIIAEFFKKDDAYLFEQELIKENFKNKKCLNKFYDDKNKLRFRSYGRIISDNTRKKISNGNKGKSRTEEARKKYSISKSGKNHHFYGKKLTIEHRNKISLARTGIKLSQETKDKINIKYPKIGSTNPFSGKKHSEDSLYRMKQKLRIFSPSEEILIFAMYKSGITRKQIKNLYKDRIKSKKSIDKIIYRFSNFSIT